MEENDFSINREKFLEEADKKGIWIPSSNKEDYEMVEVKCTIEAAKYHCKEFTIAIQIRFPDGTRRGAYIHKSSFGTFNGKKINDISDEEIHKEMGKTADMFEKAKGKKIKLMIYKNQIGE